MEGEYCIDKNLDELALDKLSLDKLGMNPCLHTFGTSSHSLLHVLIGSYFLKVTNHTWIPHAVVV